MERTPNFPLGKNIAFLLRGVILVPDSPTFFGEPRLSGTKIRLEPEPFSASWFLSSRVLEKLSGTKRKRSGGQGGKGGGPDAYDHPSRKSSLKNFSGNIEKGPEKATLEMSGGAPT